MMKKTSLFTLCLATAGSLFANYDVTFESLLNEMADRTAVAQWPEHEYKQVQHSSYNRATKTPDDPKGWFANGDTGHVIRVEQNHGRRELVMMEHDGPGVITRMWAPFFHGGFNNRVGETVRFYFDGSTEPDFETNHIALLTGKGPVAAPFGQFTARAGDLYLPIPFAKSCKITIENSAPFYNISFRAYDPDVKVETFNPSMIESHAATMQRIGEELVNPSAPNAKDRKTLKKSIAAGETKTLKLKKGSNVIQQLTFKVDAADRGQAHRSTVLEIEFDGQPTVWCPIGDFFATVRTVEPYNTWERDVLEDGTMICRWLMPYEKSATLKLHNLGEQEVSVQALVESSPITWNDRMMHFYAGWTTLGPLAPNPKLDMNFLKAEGRGIHVGDNITVVNPHWAWWGEGDEKIWVDDDFERNFPSQIGTGTEDYYGWAGGRHPTRADEFSVPFLANVRVGGEDSGKPEPDGLIHTRGYNTCTRTRSLDANMFRERIQFDVEHWQWHQGKTDWLHYSKSVFWYAFPETTHNRQPMPEEVAKTLVTPEWVEEYALAQAEANRFQVEGALDVEKLLTRSVPNHVRTHTQEITQGAGKQRFNQDTIQFFQGARAGDAFEFTVTEQYVDREISVYLAQSWDFGTVDIYVNDKLVKEGWDGYAAQVQAAPALKLGKHSPDGNFIRVKFVVTGKSDQSKGTFLGVDCLVLK